MRPEISNGKFKVIVFIGKNMGSANKEIKDAAGELRDVKIIRGAIKDINYSDIAGKTDENTMFVVMAHGIRHC